MPDQESSPTSPSSTSEDTYSEGLCLEDFDQFTRSLREEQTKRQPSLIESSSSFQHLHDPESRCPALESKSTSFLCHTKRQIGRTTRFTQFQSIYSKQLLHETFITVVAGSVYKFNLVRESTASNDDATNVATEQREHKTSSRKLLKKTAFCGLLLAIHNSICSFPGSHLHQFSFLQPSLCNQVLL